MGRPKALLPWPATQLPLVIHVTRTLRDAGVGPLAVVTGEHHDVITAALAGSVVEVLYNPRHPDGQLGSLLHGLRWAFAQTAGDWVLATLVDVPAVQSSTVRSLVLQTRSAVAARAIRPVLGSRHGHPVLWRRDVLALLESADPSQGAKAVMRSLAAQGAVCDVPVDDGGVLSDLDTPEDYDALMRAAGPESAIIAGRMTEPEDFHPEEDFAALFEASTRASRFTRGQAVEGTIVGIGDEVALVDIGSKSEAVLDVAELKDDDGVLEAAVGDRIAAVVIDTVGGLKLSRTLVRKAASDKEIEDAYHARLPVEGTVQAVVKGGYEVKIGRSRAFCPFSQIDVVRTESPEVHIGQTYTFRITEFKEAGRNIVVSRRTFLEMEQQARAEEVRRSIVPGAVLTGRVVSVPSFGAFVDLGGGVQGLLHVSEMGWSRIAEASAAVAVGDEITVKVLRVDEATQKIALGLKQLAEDPWTKVAGTYEVGQVRPGRVTRLADFGAFVELEPGIEALAHASTFPPSSQRGSWRRAVQVGMTGAFQVLSVDPDKKRIGVTLVPEGTTAASLAAEAAEQAEATSRATVTQVAGFGSLADKLRDALKPR